MPRQVRIEFAGATYHVMCRGDRQEVIYRDDADRTLFLRSVGEAAARTGWLVHAYALMSNHYHLLIETPEPNLVRGMAWLQTAFTCRINHRHRLSGHLFGGRYKAVVVDAGDFRYFTTLLDYIHLNPVRAGLLRPSSGEDWLAYPWTSLPGYLVPRLRPKWLYVKRAFGEWGWSDDATGRRRMQADLDRRMVIETPEHAGLVEIDGQSLQSTLRRGWYYGRAEFRDLLLEKAETVLAAKRRPRRNYHGEEVQAHDEVAARRLIEDWLRETALPAEGLAVMPKGDPLKAAIAQIVHARTTVRLAWLAQQLHMGSPANVIHAIRRLEARAKN